MTDNVSKSTPKGPQTGPCYRCGQKRDKKGNRYCRACHAAYQRENRPSYSDLPPLEVEHAIARSYANTLQRRGKLIPQPCEVCGTTVDIEKHHPDYRFPLAVMWLCHAHHIALENELRKADRRVNNRSKK